MPLLGKTKKEDLDNFAQYVVAERAKTMQTFDQRGQTCGIYALAAALKTYGEIQIPIVETLNHAQPTPSKLGVSSMRYEAKHALKITKIGELFDAKDVVTLSKQYGHVAEVKRLEINNFFQTISLSIGKNRLVMIPFFPNDITGHPEPSGGTDGAHWCLAIGYLNALNGRHKILVTHWDRFFGFDAYDCWQSNANLKNFKEAYYFKEKGGGIDTYRDLGDVLKDINEKIDEDNRKYKRMMPQTPHVKIEDLARNPNKYNKYIQDIYVEPWKFKKVVNIPGVNLNRTLAKQVVII